MLSSFSFFGRGFPWGVVPAIYAQMMGNPRPKKEEFEIVRREKAHADDQIRAS
jgi:hypothetical protein